MSGSREGGLKTKAFHLSRDPEWYRKIGKLGGQAKVPKGFALSGKASEAGRIGGRKSRRNG